MSDGVAAPAAPAAPAPSGDSAKAAPAQTPNQAQAQKFKLEDLEFQSAADAKAEVLRGRQANKLLTESDKRLKAAAEKEKALEGLKKTKRFKDFMAFTGMSQEEALQEAAQFFYENELVPKQQDPRERELAAHKARIKEFEEKEARTKREAEEKEHQAATAREVEQIRKDLEEALNSKKIPGTRYFVRRVAEYMQAYNQHGVKIPTQVAVDRALADYKKETSELFDEASVDQLISLFGEDRWRKLAKKVSTWALGKAKQPPAAPAMPVANQNVDQGKRSIRPQDFEKFIKGVK